MRGNYLWRLLATGFSFVSFGIGGSAVSIMVFPLLRLIPMGAQRRKRAGQRCVNWLFRYCIWQFRTLGLLSYQIQGRQYLNTSGCLMVANHPTLIDVVFSIAQMKQVECVVKQALWYNPVTWGPVSAAGYISNSNDSNQLIADCVAALQQGRNLLVFPEGTRTKPGQPAKLQRGAANIAVYANSPICPITIECQPLTLSKGEKWYRIPAHRPHFRILIEAPRPLSEMIDHNTTKPVAARQLTRYLEHYYAPANIQQRLDSACV